MMRGLLILSKTGSSFIYALEQSFRLVLMTYMIHDFF